MPRKAQTRLRAVADGEKPAGPRTMAVDVAAREGTDLEFLMSIRDRVATQVADPTCPARELASLTRRLEEVRKLINAEKARLSDESGGVDVEDGEFDADAI